MIQLSKQEGFSLIELLFVIVLIGTLAAFFLGGLRNEQADSLKVIDRVEAALTERRSAAISLMQRNGQDGEVQRLPIGINFADPATTAPLLTSGEDANNDGVDDNSTRPITTWVISQNKWKFGYSAEPVELPPTWKLVRNRNELTPIPPIPNSNLTTEIYFNEDGTPTTPAGFEKSDEASFWTIYFVDRKAGDIAVALAVHGSGLVEAWRYDPTKKEWLGYGGRR